MNTFVGQVGLVDSESSGWPREWGFVWVLSGGINQVKRIVEQMVDEYDRGLRFD